MATSDTNELAASPLKPLWQRVSDFGTRHISDFGERIAGNRAGQFLFRKVDDALRVLEKSVQWSVRPQINPSPLEATDTEKKSNDCLMTNGSKKSKTYPVRKGAEVRARIMKKDVATPKHIIRYIQGVRRRLRAIKYRGMRNARTGVATLGDANKTHASTTPSLPSSPSVSKSKQPSDESNLGSDPLSKNKRKLSDRDESSSDDDDANDADDAADDAADNEATPSRQGSYLNRLLDATEASDSDNDPDFQPNSSMEANSTDSDALGSDDSDNEPPHSVEVKRLSQPTSLINADIIEEEVEDSVDSSTISISEVEDHDVDWKSEMNSKEGSVSGRGVAEGGVGEDHDQETGQNDEAGSEYNSCTVSLSAKSVDIASSMEKSDRSDSSAMQKMSSLFSIKKKSVDIK